MGAVWGWRGVGRAMKERVVVERRDVPHGGTHAVGTACNSRIYGKRYFGTALRVRSVAEDGRCTTAARQRTRVPGAIRAQKGAGGGFAQ